MGCKLMERAGKGDSRHGALSCSVQAAAQEGDLVAEAWSVWGFAWRVWWRREEQQV